MERRELARLAGRMGGFSLPSHISLADDKFTAVDDAGTEVRIPTEVLHCVIVDFNEKYSRTYYGKPYDKSDTSPPICFSDNGIGPSVRSLEPQAVSCKPDLDGVHGCRWAVWGSAVGQGGRGIPACRTHLKLAVILVKVDNKKWVPVLKENPGMLFYLAVPPASLGNVQAYGKTVRGFGSIRPDNTEEDIPCDLPYVITQVKFVGNKVIDFECVGYTNGPIDRVIDEIPQAKVDLAINRDDEPITALPAPDKKPEAPKATLQQPMPLQAPQAALPAKRPPGRPKTKSAPAAQASARGPFANGLVAAPPFEPKPNDRFVTSEDVRQHAEQKGIVDEAPEPPDDLEKYLGEL
jgi:hypothetical protein